MSPKNGKIKCTISRMYSREKEKKNVKRDWLCCGKQEDFNKYQTRELSGSRGKRHYEPLVNFGVPTKTNWF